MSIQLSAASSPNVHPADMDNAKSKEERFDDTYHRTLKAFEDHIQNELGHQDDLKIFGYLKKIFYHIQQRAILLRDGIILDITLWDLQLPKKTEKLFHEFNEAIRSYDEIFSGEEKIPIIKKDIAGLVRLCKELEPQSLEDVPQTIEKNEAKSEDPEEPSVSQASTSDVARPKDFQQTAEENEAKSEDSDVVTKTSALSRWIIEQQNKTELTLQVLGKGNWNGAAGIISLGDHLYIVQKGALYQVDPTNGSYEQLGGDAWKNTAAMTAWGDHLYIVQKSALYQVDPKDGSYEQLGGDVWKNTAAMTAWGDHLYIVQKSALYQVDPKDGSYIPRGGDNWKNTAAMTAWRNHLYIVQKNYLWKVNPANGDYKKLGEKEAWKGTTAMTALGDHLYIVQKDHLYKTDPRTGEYDDLGDGYTGAYAHVFPNSNLIYVVQDKLKTIFIPGEEAVISSGGVHSTLQNF